MNNQLLLNDEASIKADKIKLDEAGKKLLKDEMKLLQDHLVEIKKKGFFLNTLEG